MAGCFSPGRPDRMLLRVGKEPAGSYTTRSLPEKTVEAPENVGASQKFTPVGTSLKSGGHLFHSDTFDRLIRQALAKSPTLALARPLFPNSISTRCVFPRCFP
jgi:hypothetical protein